MRLTKGLFWSHWERICRRFGRDPSQADAADYYAFLSPRMEAEEFLEAAQAVWATAKWFPRPGDFLTVRIAKEWREVLAMAGPEGWDKDRWSALTQAAKNAVEACGGLRGIGANNDVFRTRKAFTEAYETEIQAMALEAPAPLRHISG